MTRRRLVQLLVIVVLAVQFLPTAAQARATGGSIDYREMRGLQLVVWARHYGPPATYGAATPVQSFGYPTASTPVVATSFLWRIVVVVHEFDTTVNAANAFAQISEGIGPMLVDDYSPGMMVPGTMDIHTEALTGIGTRATLTRPDVTGIIHNTAMEAVTVQRDQYVYYVVSYAYVTAGSSGSADAITALPTVEVAVAIEASGARDAAEVTFRPDGTSTGGLWGFMPAPGDRALHGLVPVGDEPVYVVPVMEAMPFPEQPTPPPPSDAARGRSYAKAGMISSAKRAIGSRSWATFGM